MKIFLAVFLSAFFAVTSFANAAETKNRKPASVSSAIWETREIPVGKACPSQAQRWDQIAYEYGPAGSGYVCFDCDYTDQSPLLVVTVQSKCPTTIKCQNGKCR